MKVEHYQVEGDVGQPRRPLLNEHCRAAANYSASHLFLIITGKV